MKTLLAILLLSASSTAFAVDVTITLTTAQATRVAALCGKQTGAMDTATPPAPRSCTMAEARTWLIGLLRAAVMNGEYNAAQQAITSTPLDVQ